MTSVFLLVTPKLPQHHTTFCCYHCERAPSQVSVTHKLLKQIFKRKKTAEYINYSIKVLKVSYYWVIHHYKHFHSMTSYSGVILTTYLLVQPCSELQMSLCND